MLATLFVATPAMAEENHRAWVDYPAISPDGSTIAFAYHGQIHLVDAQGGDAVAITGQEAYASHPVWGPESRYLAYASDYAGSDDVYLADLGDDRQSQAQRLTWSSYADRPASFSPDGGSVLFSRASAPGDPERTIKVPVMTQRHLYSLDRSSGRREMLLSDDGAEGRWNAGETQLLYEVDLSLDPGSRQNRAAANARQIWLYDAGEDRHRQLFEAEYDTLDPQWGPDEESVYYLGESDGTLNVWRYDLRSAEHSQLTHFEGRPVRALSVADNGDMAYLQGGAIHRHAADANSGEAVDIAFTMQRLPEVAREAVDATGEFAASPDGALFAMVGGGEIFLATRDGDFRQITRTAHPENAPDFSPDGMTLIYTARKGETWSIHGIDLHRDELGDELALRYDDDPILEMDRNILSPKFSPDGSKIAFIYARREVRVLDRETGEITALFSEDDYNTSYGDGDLWFEWSPDSRHLIFNYAYVPDDPGNRIGIAPADGSAPIRPVTERIAEQMKATWSADGSHIVVSTSMYSQRNLDGSPDANAFYRVFMSEEARGDFLDWRDSGFAPQTDAGGGEQVTLQRYEFADTRSASLEGLVSPELFPTQLLVDFIGIPEFFTIAARGPGTGAIVAVDQAGGAVQPVADIELNQLEAVEIVPARREIVTRSSNTLEIIPLDDPSAGQRIELSLESVVDKDERRRVAFEQVWDDIRDKFYRKDIQGRDWDSIGAYYRSFLPSIADDRALVSLIQEMYGEISASHLFVHLSDPLGPPPSTETGSLGLYMEDSDSGVRIAGVMPGGPLDRPIFDIDVGDRIVAIDGYAVATVGHAERVLDGSAGDQLALDLATADGSNTWRVAARPVSLAEEHRLDYLRWANDNARFVDDISGGCIVYVHVPAMDNDAYLDTYGKLLGHRQAAQAALIDIRGNTGGNLTRELVRFLGGEAFQMLGREGRRMATQPTDQWIGPSAVLVDSYSYSDGSIFPQSYQDLGLGNLIGSPLVNTGTAIDTIQSDILPALSYSMPVLPFRRMDGSYYENSVIFPDVEAPFDANLAAEGRDNQLESAVDALLQTIGGPDDCR